MNPRALWRVLRNLPVGVKLPATLVAVVGLTALSVTYLLGGDSRQYLYSAASARLAWQLQEVAHHTAITPDAGRDWPGLLQDALNRLRSRTSLSLPLPAFVLDQQGRLLANLGNGPPLS